MGDEEARVLAREGNTAVVQLPGRAFPGIHTQGDTFAEMQRRLAEVAVLMRHAVAPCAALDDLDDVILDMTEALRFYEAIIAERGVTPPYPKRPLG